jgi:hypothetical protein
VPQLFCNPLHIRETAGLKVLFRAQRAFRYQPTWGFVSDQIAVADFNGDDRDDIAVFRTSDGNWYIIYENGATDIRNFGNPGLLAVPADYDGDNIADLGVYRPSNGYWSVRYSTTGCPCRAPLGTTAE